MFSLKKIHKPLKPIPLFAQKKNAWNFFHTFQLFRLHILQYATTPVFPGVPLWGNTGTDIGTEELAHMEIVCAIVHQLTKNLTADELQEQGFAPYYIDHTIGLWPQAASGEPWSASMIQSTGDPIADMHEDMAAEQKARLTYDNILRLAKDPEVCDPIRYLREREIVHYQRFGESLRLIQDELNSKNFYAFNKDFDKQFCK